MQRRKLIVGGLLVSSAVAICSYRLATTRSKHVTVESEEHSTGEPAGESSSLEAADDVSLQMNKMRLDLAKLREQVAEREQSTREPQPEPPTGAEGQRGTGEDPQVVIARREASLRDHLAGENRDRVWRAELSTALEETVKKLPGASVTSTECGTSICVSEVHHAREHSAADLWGALPSMPLFEGPVLLATHDDGNERRTSIYIGNAESDSSLWDE